MTFIDALVLIKTSKNFRLCDCKDELIGIYPSICVYKNDCFIGKLRWANNNEPASVDEELIDALKKDVIKGE